MSATCGEVEGATRRGAGSRVRKPALAWPTLVLWVLCVLGAAAGVWGGASGWLPLWLAGALVALSQYASFTPMHDSAHRSVSRWRWVNGLVGRACAVLLMAPFGPFRYAHLRHHHHTNDPERDPDHWSGAGAWWQLPLRWSMQDYHYYVVYARAWSSRPRGERAEAALTVGLLLALLVGLVWAGYGVEVLLLWWLPSRAAICMLAFLFDYLPHRPHEVRAREDAEAATRNLGRAWLTPVMLYQNYHLAHHVEPGVPFYRYKAAWEARQRWRVGTQ
jgi:beta-carotene hydroxylase